MTDVFLSGSDAMRGGDDAFVYPSQPAGHPFIGMEKDPANAVRPHTLTVVINGELLRVGPVHREWWCNGKRHYLRELVEV